MVVQPRIEIPVRARFDECGPAGTARSSAYLRWAQDIAWQHSEEAGFDREWYAARSLTWLVRSLELDIVGEVRHGEAVRVSTQVTGLRRVWARRRTEITGMDDERPRAVLLIDWVMLGPNGPQRVPDEIATVFGTRPASYAPLRIDLDAMPSAVTRRTFPVRRQELDPMGHVNHAVYLDWFEEALIDAGEADTLDRVPRRYRLEYVASAAPGDTLEAALWPIELGWGYRVTTGGDGAEVFRARLEDDPAAWVGG